MKRTLRIASLAVALAVLGTWTAKGVNTGWTIDKVQTRKTDEITGIDQIVWVEKWVPGIDFLAVGLACSGILLIASLPLKPKNKTTPVP